MTAAFRQMNHTDIPSGLLLCRNNNWNQLARDWELFLTLSPDDCRVAIENEKITGSVTTISYQRKFNWIGMLLVDPSHQRKGIGKKLLNEALHILRNEETVKLDATPAGRELYKQLDFKDEYQLLRMQNVTTATANINSTATPLQKNDLYKIIAFDTIVFGANREALLQWFWEGANEFAFIINENHSVIGYCLGRRGYHFNQIGPVVANSITQAKQLVAAALNNCNTKPVIIDALLHNSQWVDWLKDIGFVEQRTFTRMYKGVNRYPGIPEKQYAIAGPEYG